MRRRGGADSFDNTISMPRWTRVNYYILHELAHIANDYIHNFDYSEDYEGGGAWPGYTDPDTGEDVLTQRVAAHGPEYCGVYLYLVRAFMGDEAHDSLAASFANYKVKVAPVRVATRNVADKETPVTVMDTPVTDTDTPVSTAPDELSVTDTDTRCRECGQRLGSRQAFCSDRCRWTYHNRLRHERGAGDREKVCESCGAAFTAKRADARTCSPACRQKLHRTRSR
jgi:predicted nucleic acid-binding Zn ribbon protein